jgi:hypothetical protein
MRQRQTARKRMNDGQRLERLHLLRDRLERQPASPDRDWMLSEVRARAVDVETSARPRPMRPFDAEATNPSPEGTRREGGKVDGVHSRVTRSAPRPTHRPTEIRQVTAQAVSAPPEVAVPPMTDALGRASAAEHAGSVDLLEDGGLLCLDDLPLAASPPDRYTSPRPWARGLRG